MNNEEKYTNAFTETFDVEAGEVPGLKFNSIPEWDSVGHMRLMAALEEAFDIMFETEDTIDFASYEKGKEILSNNYDVKF